MDLSHTLEVNQHIPLIREVSALLTARYKVRAKLVYSGHGGDWLWISNQRILWRENKKGDFSKHNDITILDHNLSHKGGGSNKYPTLADTKDQYCVIEFISQGIPFVDHKNGWLMHIISITKHD